jgi:hypothetical protein
MIHTQYTHNSTKILISPVHKAQFKRFSSGKFSLPESQLDVQTPVLQQLSACDKRQGVSMQGQKWYAAHQYTIHLADALSQQKHGTTLFQQ